ncbi:hypothetical protein AWJ20_1087 [Sugiyamaella lignohabitans]|uniref:Uncharacterized protein n=1 Tax=Sugiyamaella lignohabitans TaxID=796027 RepID=A0A167DE85_9ASCO|nr:uncharacterized protein AWJ20_1087 [Sugiyamaella lignohabitans]ANB12815.1 hypothetical protein AWJ20_1087 [Sugiyamaella lignohabitans]
MPRIKLRKAYPVTTIALIPIEKIKDRFFSILASKSSIPDSLLAFVDEGIALGWANEYEGVIPFKLTLCRVAVAVVRKQNMPINHLVTTSTDVLRIMASLSDGDIELIKKIKFKSFPRKTRRILVSALEKVISTSDIKRYPDLWKRAFHSLHIGEYGGRAASIASKFRNTNNVHTPETAIAEALKGGVIHTAVEGLVRQPSVFGRTLDKLLRDCQNESDFDYVLGAFSRVVSSVETKVLIQLLGHFQGRLDDSVTTRLVFTKGSKPKILEAPKLPAINHIYATKLLQLITSALESSFKERALLACYEVYISRDVHNVVVPLQLASANNNKRTVARGSRITLEDDDKPILRLFIHWIGYDIDLSAVLLSGDLKREKVINFSNLRAGDFAVHSGDITRAPGPEGASEFIDIDMEKAMNAGFRYVVLDVRVYTSLGGLVFSSLEQCFAGFMLRESLEAGEIFEPTTVRAKFDLTSDTRAVNPCLFDMETKEVVWMDVTTLHVSDHGNSVSHNVQAVSKVVQSCLEMYKTKVTIPQLIKLHADASNAVITTNRLHANFTVGFGPEFDLDVNDFADINSRWV